MDTYIFVGVELSLHRVIEYLEYIQIFMAAEMDSASLIFVVNKKKANLIAQKGQLHGLLEQALLTLAVGYLQKSVRCNGLNLARSAKDLCCDIEPNL